jgi:uncharacterized protein YecE (DUF72 family)
MERSGDISGSSGGGRKPQLRIGCSGYQYDHWRGVFYPAELPKRLWFEHYARHFDTVEVNNTFYRLPSKAAFERWRDEAPRGFIYALKFSRYGSHRKRLKDPDNTIVHFTNLADELGRFLGPILVQLPPRWKVNVERLESFLAFAPRHYRWAIEVRDPSWLVGEVFAVLHRYRAALCIHDMIPDHSREMTAGWTYLRFHGGVGHEGAYEAGRLREEAGRIRDELRAGRDVYAYFNNDQHGHAVRNAMELRSLVGMR